MSDLVLFDFDGTLTQRDTTRELLLVLAQHRPARAILVLPFLISLILSRGNEERVQNMKCSMLGTMLHGLTRAELDPLLARFRDRVLPSLRAAVIDCLLEHQRCGARVLVVTASPRIAVEAVLDFAQVPVIGTEFTQTRDYLSGTIYGVPCHGEAKLVALDHFLEENGIIRVVREAWSDSWSDLPVMRLANRRVWVVPRNLAEAFRAKDPAADLFVVE